MSFADIESTWRSPENRPTPSQLDAHKIHFAGELRRRRRGTALFLTTIFIVLGAITVRLVAHLIAPAAGSSPIDPRREWGAPLFIVLPWTAAVLFAVRQRTHYAKHANPDASIADNLRALLDENRLARLRLKTVAILHGAMLVLLPLIVHQLRAVGKAGDEIVVPAFVIWPVIAIAILVAMALHDRRKLAPRQQELETLLRSYE